MVNLVALESDHLYKPRNKSETLNQLRAFSQISRPTIHFPSTSKPVRQRTTPKQAKKLKQKTKVVQYNLKWTEANLSTKTQLTDNPNQLKNFKIANRAPVIGRVRVVNKPIVKVLQTNRAKVILTQIWKNQT